MWIFYIFSFLILTSATASNDFYSGDNLILYPQDRFNESTIFNEVFEVLRNIIKNGNSDYGIPVLDPLKFFDYKTEINIRNVIKANIFFDDVSITGLGDFKVTKSEFFNKEMAFDIGVTFPSLLFKSEHYGMKGDVFGAVPLAGDGIFEINFIDLSFSGKIYLKQSEDGKLIFIDKLINPEYDLWRVESNIELDRNFDDIANAVIEDIIPLYLNRFSKYVTRKYTEMLVNVINDYLSTIDLW